jgi:hypothetical protein
LGPASSLGGAHHTSSVGAELSVWVLSPLVFHNKPERRMGHLSLLYGERTLVSERLGDLDKATLQGGFETSPRYRVIGFAISGSSEDKLLCLNSRSTTTS